MQKLMWMFWSYCLISTSMIGQTSITDNKFRGIRVFSDTEFAGEVTRFVKKKQVIAIDECLSIKVYGPWKLVDVRDKEIIFEETDGDLVIPEGVYELQKTNKEYDAIVYPEPKYKGDALYIEAGKHQAFPFEVRSMKVKLNTAAKVVTDDHKSICIKEFAPHLVGFVEEIDISTKFLQCAMSGQ